jgi:hypothetical protein
MGHNAVLDVKNNPNTSRQLQTLLKKKTPQLQQNPSA